MGFTRFNSIEYAAICYIKTTFKYRQANTFSSSVLLIYKLEQELNGSQSGKCGLVKRHVYIGLLFQSVSTIKTQQVSSVLHHHHHHPHHLIENKSWNNPQLVLKQSFSDSLAYQYTMIGWIVGKPKHIMVARRKIGAQMNSITNITVQLVSYPKPTAEWRTYTGRDWTVQQDGVQYKYILTSSIEVKDQSDFKLYIFRIVNQLGYVDLNIRLIPKGKMSYCLLVWNLLL